MGMTEGDAHSPVRNVDPGEPALCTTGLCNVIYETIMVTWT